MSFRHHAIHNNNDCHNKSLTYICIAALIDPPKDLESLKIHYNVN